MDLRFGSLAWWLTDRRTGRRVIGQRPNGPILVVSAARALAQAAPTPGLRRVARAVGAAALAWWSLLEIVSGVNPWRRLLGVAGAVSAAVEVLAISRGEPAPPRSSAGTP